MNTPLDDGGPVASVMTLGDKGEVVPVGGLSIRDWFAGMALQGVMANAHGLGEMDSDERAALLKRVGSLLFEVSDAMLAARKERS